MAKTRAYRKKLQEQQKQYISEYRDARACQGCGNKEKLEFHHLDPSEKVCNVTSIPTRRMSWEQLYDEIQKCVLLCNACHKEVHRAVVDC